MIAFDEAWTFLKAKKPFRMKRPEMLHETTGIMDELARREWNRGDKGKDEFGFFTGPGQEQDQSTLEELGNVDYRRDKDDTENISDKTFRSTRPEMEERLLAIQTELARRGKPSIGEKFRDVHSDEGIADDGSTMWQESPSLAESMLAENRDLVDESAEEGKDVHEYLRDNRVQQDQLNDYSDKNKKWFENLMGIRDYNPQ